MKRLYCHLKSNSESLLNRLPKISVPEEVNTDHLGLCAGEMQMLEGLVELDLAKCSQESGTPNVAIFCSRRTGHDLSEHELLSSPATE